MQSYEFGLTPTAYTAAAQSDAGVGYEAANAQVYIEPHFVWRSSAAGHWWEADFGSAVTITRAWLGFTNIATANIFRADASGTGGTNMFGGAATIPFDAQVERGLAWLTATNTGSNRFLRVEPLTYHDGGSAVEIGQAAFYVAAQVVTLQDERGGAVQWERVQDRRLTRFPGGGPRIAEYGGPYVVAEVSNQDWLKESSLQVQAHLERVQAMNGSPFVVAEVWRTPPRAYMVAHTDARHRWVERFQTFTLTFQVEELH